MKHLAILMVLCAGCVGPTLGSGGDDDDSSPADGGPDDVAVDLLIVVDNSQSMDRIQTELQNNLPHALADHIAQGASLRVGVTTTDLFAPGPGNQGNLRGAGPIGQGACSDGDALVDGDPDFVNNLQDRLDVGITGAGEENGLLTGVLAACKAGDNAFWADMQAADPNDPLASICMSVPADDRACNADFLRADAELVVLVVTDEGDAASNSATAPTEQWLSDCTSAGTPECDCRTSAYVDAYDALGARLFVMGPSYQEGPTPWCDGSSVAVPGPCNAFNSPACAIDLQQDASCGTGGAWWPIEVRQGDLCSDVDYGNFAMEFVAAL